MRSPYYAQRGQISFEGVTSEAEIDWLHTRVLSEEVRLNQILEYNNSRLIRLGIAEKVEATEIAINLRMMLANWSLSSLNPSPEKIKLCTERELARIGPQTQFRVGENLMEKIWGTESPGASGLYVGIADLERGSSTWHKVGDRVIESGETVGYMPKILDEASGLSLSDRELLEVAALVDAMKLEKAEGNLPHLTDAGDIDHLHVIGLAGPIHT